MIYRTARAPCGLILPRFYNAVVHQIVENSRVVLNNGKEHPLPSLGSSPPHPLRTVVLCTQSIERSSARRDGVDGVKYGSKGLWRPFLCQVGGEHPLDFWRLGNMLLPVLLCLDDLNLLIRVDIEPPWWKTGDQSPGEVRFELSVEFGPVMLVLKIIENNLGKSLEMLGKGHFYARRKWVEVLLRALVVLSGWLLKDSFPFSDSSNTRPTSPTSPTRPVHHTSNVHVPRPATSTVLDKYSTPAVLNIGV